MVPLPIGPQRTLLAIGLALFGVLLLRTAWMSDDAYLTLRSVEHAATGFGVRWNAADRVQVYDHPLWMLTLLGGRLLSGEMYFTTLAISMAASLTAVGIVLRRATTELSVVVALAAAVLSPLFVTFSTSGLESPLVHVLVAAFMAAVLGGRPAPTLAAIAGLLILTHWTTVFLVAPVLVSLLAVSGRRTRLVVALGAGPMFVWLAGVWWYYGTLGSTPQLAGRSAALPWREQIAAGWSFLQETTKLDPLLVAVAMVGVFLGMVMRGSAARLAIGSGLAIGWAVLSGGSDMAGRHLTASFVMGLGLLVRYLATSGGAAGVVALAGVLIYAAMSPLSTLTSGAAYGRDFAPTARTRDARAEAYQATGLLLESRPRRAPSHPDIDEALASMTPDRVIATERLPGMVGFVAGPDAYVLDDQGRTDPLVARLPPAIGPRTLRDAHRRLPDGYVEGLPDGSPAEPPLAEMTDDIREITRGRLISWRRAGRLLALPRRVDAAVASSSYGPLDLPLDALVTGVDVVVPEGGVIVRLPARQRLSRLTVTLTGSYDYIADVMNGSSAVATLESPRVHWMSQDDSPRALAFTPEVTGTALRFRCGRGIGRCRLSQVTIDR